MNRLTSAAMLFSAVLLGTAFSSSVRAGEWNQLTTVTFNEPVEVPGAVLPAGTYVFRLLGSESDRNIVQIFNQHQTKLYATILAIPDYRLQPTGKTVITFEERPAGSPEAIKAWFYPGDQYGQEFVYPTARATELAKAAKQPVLSMPSEMASNITKPARSAKAPSVVAMKKAPVKAQKPTGEEVEITEVITPPPAHVAQAQLPKHLPTSASSLPLVMLIGLLSLGAGFTLRLVSSRIA